MRKQNNEDIIEHYDLKYNRDKQGFVGIFIVLLISLFMLLHLYYMYNTCFKDNINNYLFIASGILILISILMSIGFAFNNTID
jgi:hypothetical protein